MWRNIDVELVAVRRGPGFCHIVSNVRSRLFKLNKAIAVTLGSAISIAIPDTGLVSISPADEGEVLFSVDVVARNLIVSANEKDSIPGIRRNRYVRKSRPSGLILI